MNKRAHVILPLDLVAEIDELVGKNGCSAFIAEVARDEILRRRQRAALRKSAGAWKDEDHPELAQGAAAWVHKMRAEGDRRLEAVEEHRDD